MSKIGFRGFPSGQTVTLGASAGGVTAPAASATWPSQAEPTEDAFFIAGVPIKHAEARALGANTTKNDFHNLNVRGTNTPHNSVAGGPPRTVIVRAVTGYASNVVDASNLLYFAVYSTTFWAGGTAEIWRIENGEMVLKRTSAIVSATNTAVTLASDGGVAAQAGDMLLMRQAILAPGDALSDVRFAGTANEPLLRMTPLSKAFNTWLGDDANDTGAWVDDNGTWCIEYDLSLSVASSRDIEFARFSGTGQSFYRIPEAGETWRVDIDLKADAAKTVSLNLNYPGVTVTKVNGATVSTTFPVDLSVTTSRQVFSVEFQFSTVETGDVARFLDLTFNQAGIYTLYAGNAYEASAPFQGMTSATLARYSQASLDHIRDHSFVKTNQAGKAYDLRALIVGYLHPSLNNTVAIGAPRFWLQPEFYLINEAAGLVEYLCGTSGPWATLRQSLGRTDPWIDDLEFLFEISNETWNSLNSFYTFPAMTDVPAGDVAYTQAQVYGLFFQTFIDTMKAAPSWSSAVEAAFTFVIGGRFNTDYGDVAATLAPDATYVTRAPYVRGWEVGAGGVTDSPQGFFETLFWPATVTPARLSDAAGWLATAKANGANPALKDGTYEDAISFSNLPPGIPEDEIRFAKTKGAGICWLDKIARQAAVYSLQSHFLMGLGEDWHTHHPATLEPYPFHLWTIEWNNRMAGVMHEVFRIQSPTRDVTVASDSYPATDEIGCYVTSNGTRRSVLLVNRNLPYDAIDSGDALYDAADSGARTVRVRLPWNAATSHERRAMNGAFNDQVWDSSITATYETFAVTATALGPYAGGDLTVTIPAAEAYLYVFEGVT